MLDTSLFYQKFLGFSRYPSINILIHRAFFLKSLSARSKLDTSSIYQRCFAVDTSSIPLNLSSFCSWHLLDTFSIYRGVCFYIYLRLDPILFSLKHFDPSLLSLNPNPIFSPKTFFPSQFWTFPSFCFCWDIWSFCVFDKIFGMGFVILLSYDHVLHSLSL